MNKYNKPFTKEQRITPLPEDTHLLLDSLCTLTAIQNTSSKKEKEQLLKENNKDDTLIYLLKFLYDKHITTGIATTKLNKQKQAINNNNTDTPNILPQSTFTKLIAYLSTNNTGKDIYVIQAIKTIEQYPEPLQDDLYKIITKTYKAGITSSTVNKAIPNLITTEFKVMKGYHLNKDNNEKYLHNKEFVVTLKFDGYNTTAIKENNTIKLYSSSGQLYESLIELEEQFLKPHIPDGVYIGEIIIKDTYTDYNDCFQRTSKIIKKKEPKSNLIFKVFDYIESIPAFNDNYYNKPFIQRITQLENILLSSKTTPNISYCMPLYIGADISEIYNFNRAALDLGEEGLIITISDSPYERKRTRSLFKLKQVLTLDLKIIGWEYGKKNSKYENTCGAIIVSYKNTKQHVGSGLSDELREDVKNNFEIKYLNRIAEIECMGVSTSQEENSEEALRQPRFKHLREIGKEISEN